MLIDKVNNINAQNVGLQSGVNHCIPADSFTDLKLFFMVVSLAIGAYRSGKTLSRRGIRNAEIPKSR